MFPVVLQPSTALWVLPLTLGCSCLPCDVPTLSGMYLLTLGCTTHCEVCPLPMGVPAHHGMFLLTLGCPYSLWDVSVYDKVSLLILRSASSLWVFPLTLGGSLS